MKVGDVMTSTVCAVDEATTLRQASALMARLGADTLPVVRGRHVVGMISSGDIAADRAGEVRYPDAPVALAMMRDVYACHAAELAEDVLLDMQILELWVIPVEDDYAQLVGMVSFGDLVAACPDHPRRQDLRGLYVCMPEERTDGRGRIAA